MLHNYYYNLVSDFTSKMNNAGAAEQKSNMRQLGFINPSKET